MSDRKIITLVFCSSPTEGVLYAKTFDHLTEWDAMQAAFTHVMKMAKGGSDRSYGMGDATLQHIDYTEKVKYMMEHS